MLIQLSALKMFPCCSLMISGQRRADQTSAMYHFPALTYPFTLGVVDLIIWHFTLKPSFFFVCFVFARRRVSAFYTAQTSHTCFYH